MISPSTNGTCPQTIGEIIKTLRITAGMTPEQLADSAQVSPSYVRKLEAGLRHDITLDTAKKLADGLGVSPQVFFDAEIAKPSPILVAPANPQVARQLLQWAASIQTGITSLLEEDERLRVLTDTASEAIVVLDGGTVLFVNRALINMLGLEGDPDQLMGFNALDLNSLMKYIAPASLAEAHRIATNLVQTGEIPPTPLPLDILCSDGSSQTVWIKGKEIEYQGRTVHVAVLRDSSWQDNVDADFQDSVDWKAAWDNLAAGGLFNAEDHETRALLIHNAARILYANLKTAALFGIADPKDLIGRKPLSLVSPGSLTTILNNMVDTPDGSVTIDIVTSRRIVVPVCVQWQSVRYRGTLVRVCFITELADHS